MTKEGNKNFKNFTKCWICNNDHYHAIRKYKGFAHRHFKQSFLPKFANNLGKTKNTAQFSKMGLQSDDVSILWVMSSVTNDMGHKA